MIVQIYEIQDPAEAQAVVSLGVDHVGSVILSPNNWKSPVIRDAVRAAQRCGARSGLIPLFGDPRTLFEALDYYQPDFVHFCEALSPFPGNEAPMGGDLEMLLSLHVDIKDRFPRLDIMRSLSVPEPATVPDDAVLENILYFADMLGPLCDYFLIDTIKRDGNAPGSQPVAGFVGITGDICDWRIAAAVVERSAIPVILAGGLSDENVFEAIRAVKPAGVDSCTRTNAVGEDGRPIRFKKDLGKVRRLVEEARRAEAAE